MSDKVKLFFRVVGILVLAYVSYKGVPLFWADFRVRLFEGAILSIAIICTVLWFCENVKEAFKLWVKLKQPKEEAVSPK